MSTDPRVVMSESSNHPAGCGCAKCGDKGCNKCGAANCSCGPCISWSAIFMGAFVGVGLAFLLNLFSTAIGLKAFNNTPEGATVFLAGGFIGLVISGFVSMFAAGWTAGHIGRRGNLASCKLDLMYGFVTWTITLVASMYLTAHTGKFLMDHTNVLNGGSAPTVSVDADNSNNHRAAPIIESNGGTNVVVNKTKTDNLSNLTFVMFFLFFFGALSSCFGAHCAMHCGRKENHCKM